MADQSKQRREQHRRQREHEAHQVVHDVQTDRRRRDVKLALGLGVAGIVIALASGIPFALGGFGNQSPGAETVAPTAAPGETTPAEPMHTNAENVPKPEVAEDREWTGTMTLNDVALGITIDGVNAPQAAANFISLSQSGFYNDVPCHRLTTEGIYVLQCGDPTGTGTGDPGYKFGPLENIPSDAVYPAGTIAMARAADPNSMGSQFFVVYEDTTLPGDGYTVFGHVTSGLDELKAAVIDAGIDPAKQNRPGDGAPAVETKITSIDLK